MLVVVSVFLIGFVDDSCFLMIVCFLMVGLVVCIMLLMKSCSFVLVGICFVEVCGCVSSFVFFRFCIMLWIDVGDRLRLESFEIVCDLIGVFELR